MILRNAIMIESYSFGKMVVSGTEYRSDLKILPNGVKPGWWRREGHKLRLADIQDVLEARPATMVVGTGHDGCMEVESEVGDYCREKGIRLIVERTGDAVKTFNRLGGPGVVGIFHLTC
jgi:hypothetical protein